MYGFVSQNSDEAYVHVRNRYVFVFPPVGSSHGRECQIFPPVLFLTLFPRVGASHAKEFQSSPPWGLPKLGNLK